MVICTLPSLDFPYDLFPNRASERDGKPVDSLSRDFVGYRRKSGLGWPGEACLSLTRSRHRAASLDHLVGTGEKRWRDDETKRLRRADNPKPRRQVRARGWAIELDQQQAPGCAANHLRPMRLMTGTGRLMPRNVSSPRDSTLARPSTMAANRPLVSTCPWPAWAHNRAAKLMTAPIAV